MPYPRRRRNASQFASYDSNYATQSPYQQSRGALRGIYGGRSIVDKSPRPLGSPTAGLGGGARVPGGISFTPDEDWNKFFHRDRSTIASMSPVADLGMSGSSTVPVSPLAPETPPDVAAMSSVASSPDYLDKAISGVTDWFNNKGIPPGVPTAAAYPSTVAPDYQRRLAMLSNVGDELDDEEDVYY